VNVSPAGQVMEAKVREAEHYNKIAEKLRAEARPDA
jgi:hypothetical protein